MGYVVGQDEASTKPVKLSRKNIQSTKPVIIWQLYHANTKCLQWEPTFLLIQPISGNFNLPLRCGQRTKRFVNLFMETSFWLQDLSGTSFTSSMSVTAIFFRNHHTLVHCHGGIHESQVAEYFFRNLHHNVTLSSNPRQLFPISLLYSR